MGNRNLHKNNYIAIERDWILVSCLYLKYDFSHDFVWMRAEAESVQILVHAACVYSEGRRWNCILLWFPDTVHYGALAASLFFLLVQALLFTQGVSFSF